MASYSVPRPTVPVPDTTGPVAKDNLITLDYLMNSDDPTYTNRFGRVSPTAVGIQQTISDEFNATFQAQFAYKRIGNISDYVGDSLPESDKLNSYQFPDDSGSWYGPLQNQSFPITIPADPSVDDGWAFVNSASEQWVAETVRNPNLLSNHNFLTPSPDDITHPSSSPTDYAAGTQIFSGVFVESDVVGFTYINGRVKWTNPTGAIYLSVPNTNGLEYVTEFTASVADFDGKPRTRGVSFGLVGDEYRVTVGTDALSDGVDDTPLGSVKFEQGKVATGHNTKSLFDIYGSPVMGIVNAKAFGAVGNGVADDWVALQTAVIFARMNEKTLFIPGGTYRISKPLYVTADSLSVAQSTVNGEGIQADNEYNSVKIEGAGIKDTVIRYDGSEHAFQIGEFGDSNYGLATHATWYGTVQDLTVEAPNAKYSICLVWGHYYQLERVAASGGSISTVEYFNSTTSLCLWNKAESCHFQSYTSQRNFVMRGNSNLCVDTFCAGGSESVFKVEGFRNNATRLSVENGPSSGLTPYFIECHGGCSFYDLDLETGAGGVDKGIHFLTDAQCIVQNPTIVGINGARYEVDASIARPRIMLIGAETQHNLSGNEQTIMALGNGDDTQSNILMPNVRIPQKMKRVKKTISIGVAPSWSSFQSIVGGDTHNGYGSGLVFQGLLLENTLSSTGIPAVQLRFAKPNGTNNDIDSVDAPEIGEAGIYFDAKDLKYQMYDGDDGQYVRNIQARARAGSSGTVDLTLFYIEA